LIAADPDAEHKRQSLLPPKNYFRLMACRPRRKLPTAGFTSCSRSEFGTPDAVGVRRVR